MNYSTLQINHVYALLRNMTEPITVSIAAPSDPKTFIYLCKMYIDDNPNQVEFNGDYTVLKKISKFEPIQNNTFSK